ncbi:response regulator [Spirosoma fluviale]|uniref:CheY chemotaxis protein or a CheY-like REC (Receiver) domain n=1 Tax=Spirosoma fluviale TaxID=1597977 RepID=A0A286FY19_9BACT|nr:response regulator [Spirosoma fluviale]SOD88177.1 CheY chemotaxis protein or a CheY-like REC (receiver) domain [Spirosoma fluviale]
MTTSSPFSILLVDDDPFVAEVLTRSARQNFPEASIQVKTSYAEAQAYVESLEGKGPKLILLDIDLQTGPDGFAFLYYLRNHPQGRLLPVVMLSYHDETENVEKAFSMGASLFTRKPSVYSAWQAYVQQLRHYWFETITVPTVWFGKGFTN